MTHRANITFAVALIAGLCLTAGCQTNSRLRLVGMRALDNGDLATADASFARAVEQQPADWKSLYYLGLVRLEQGRPIEAQLNLEQAYGIRDEHAETADILDALAEALYQQDAQARLHAMLRDASQRYGQTRDFLREAKYLAKIGDVDGSDLAYKKAARFARPDDVQPYVQMADFYESIGDQARAVDALQRAHYLMPDDRRIADRLRRHGVVPGPTVAVPPAHHE